MVILSLFTIYITLLNFYKLLEKISYTYQIDHLQWSWLINFFLMFVYIYLSIYLSIYIYDLLFDSVYAHFNYSVSGLFRGRFCGLKLPIPSKTVKKLQIWYVGTHKYLVLWKISFSASTHLNCMISVFSCQEKFFLPKYYLFFKR